MSARRHRRTPTRSCTRRAQRSSPNGFKFDQPPINLVVSDLDEKWFVGLSHRALRYRIDKQVADADATVTAARETLTQVVAGERTLDDAIDLGDLTIDGDDAAFRTIIDRLDVFLGGFPIVEP